MKHAHRRVISAVMVFILVFSSLASSVYAAGGGQAESFSFLPAEPAVKELSASRLTELEGQEAVYFGTAVASLDEKDGYYSIPVYREGSLDTEAAVSVLTLDVSATYGKDYELSAENVFTGETGQTLLERGNGANAIMTEEDAMEQAGLAASAYEKMYGENAETGAEEEVSAAEESEEEESSEEMQSGNGEEEQELGSLTNSLLGQLNINEEAEVDEERLSASMQSDAIDYSAGMVLHFAKGEDRKTLVFHVFDDELEEGQEMFMFVLADAEGTVIRKQLTFSAVIEDNEELHDAVISFSQESYRSEKGKVTVKIIRTGSEYSMIDFNIRSCQDTAVPGENYREFNETVTMQPYQTEAEYSFEVAGQGRMEVKLVSGTACQEGETDLAEVLIDVQETEEELKALREAEELVDSLGEEAGIEKGTAAWQEVEVSDDTEGTESRLGTGNEKKTFEITINGTSYTVKYEDAADKKTVRQGDIVDKALSSKDKDVVVGQYYFVSPNYYTYQRRYGYDSPGDWGAYYVANDDLQNSKAHIFWNARTLCRTGGSYISSNFWINSIYYGSMWPDWAGTDSRGYWHQFRFRTEFKSNGHCLESKVNEKNHGVFSRTIDSRAQINTWNSMEATELSFYAYAEDSGSAAPYNSLDVYGFACLYKVYACTLISTEGLNYRTAKGGTLEKQAPFILRATSGVSKGDDRWIFLNEDSSQSVLVFATDQVKIAGESGVFGKLTSWDLIYGMNKGDMSKRTVSYPEHFIKYLKGEIGADWRKGSCLAYGDTASINKRIEDAQTNLTAIAFDAYFAEYLQYLSYQFDDVGACGTAPVQLGFEPHIEHRQVKVKVCDPKAPFKGKFADSRLAVKDDYYLFNAGDTFDLTPVSLQGGQVADGYEYSTDEGIEWNTIRTPNEYTIPGNTEGTLWIRPNFEETGNHVGIVFENGADDIVEVRGLVSQEELQETKYKGMNILDAHPEKVDLEERIRPDLGHVYTLEIVTKKEAPAGKAYCPYVVINAYGTNPKKIYSQAFPLIGRNEKADNVYVVGVDLVSKSSLKTYEIKGNVNRQPGKSKVVSAKAAKNTPANGMNVVVSGSEQVNEQKVHYIKKEFAVTDFDGNYKLTGVTGRPGTWIALLAETDLDNGNIQYVQLPENGNTDMTAPPLTVSYPYSAPEISSISYRYGDPDHMAKYGNTSDTIHIFDDTLYVSLIVDEKQRKASEVNLVIYHISADKDTKTVKLTRQKKINEVTGEVEETDVWEGELPGMNKYLYSGDQMYAYIVDAEKRKLVVGKKADGTEETKEVKITYPVMDTGLQFAEEIVAAVPQWYSGGLDEANRINVPIAGSNGLPGATSGVISFNQVNWEGGTGYTRNVGIGLDISPMDLWNKMNRVNNYQKSVLVSKSAAANRALKTYQAKLDDLNDQQKLAVLNGSSEVSQGLIANNITATEDQLKKARAEVGDLKSQLGKNRQNMKKLNGWLDNPKGLTTETVGGGGISFAIALHFVKVKDKYVYSCGELSVGITIWVEFTKFTLFMNVVPAFVNVGGVFQFNYMESYTTKAGASAMSANAFAKVGGNISEVIATSAGKTDAKAIVGLDGHVTLGVGIKDVLNVAGFINAGWQGVFPTVKKKIPAEATAQEKAALEAANSSGHIINFGGGISVTLILLTLNLNIFSVSKGYGSLEGASQLSWFNGTVGQEALYGENGLKAAEREEIELLSKDGNEVATLVKKLSGTSDMTGFGAAVKDADIDSWSDGDYAAPITLLTQAADNTAIQTVQTDENGSLFMVFAGNRGGAEDSAEKDALYWTNYKVNAEGEGSWTEPQLLDADGIYEAIPDVSINGNHITVTWSSAEDKFASETDYLGNLSKFRIKAAVFEVEDGGVTMKVSPVFLSGQKASASVAKNEKSKGKAGSAYYDADASTWYDETEEKLYTILTRFNLSKATKITDIMDPTVTDPRVFYAEYDLSEEDTERPGQGVLMELRDISLTDDEALLNAADVGLFEVPAEDGIGTRQFMAVVYTQDVDGDLTTEEDNELMLCLIEFTDTEEGMIVYPSISFPDTNGTSEYAKGKELILGSGSVIVEDPKNYQFDEKLMKTVDYTYDTDGDGIEGIALSNAELTETAGTLWLTYLKDGYLYEMINIGDCLNEMFGEEYLAEMYRERALAVNGGRYAVTPLEQLTDASVNDDSWYRVDVEDLNQAWDGYAEREGFDKEGQGVKWYSSGKEKLSAGLYSAESNAELPEDARSFEESRLYSVSSGTFTTDETVLTADENSRTSITDYQLVSNGKDVYIVYTDFPRNTTAPVKELFCVKKNRGYQDPEQEEETEYIPPEIPEQAEIQEPEDGENDELCYYSKPVQLTDAGHVIDGFKASMSEDGTITVISRCYDQWVPEGGGIKFSEKSIIETKYRPSAMPRVDEALASAAFAVDPVSRSQFITVNYDVVNSGLEPQNGYQTWIELDHESISETEVQKDGYLRSGDTDSYFAAIPVEDLKETRTVTIVVADSNGKQVDEYVIDVDPVSELTTELTEISRTEAGGYQAAVTVYNSGSLASEPTGLKLRIQNTDYNSGSPEELKVYQELEIPALEVGESKELLISFLPEPEDFTDLGTITLEAVLDGESVGSSKIYVGGDPDMAVLEGGKDSLQLTRGTKRQLSATCEPFPEETGEVQYYSANPEIASIDESGLLSCNKNGITTVYAYLPKWGYTDDILIVVKDQGSDDDDDDENAAVSVRLPSYVEAGGDWKQDANGNWTYTTRAGVKAADRWMAIARSTFGGGDGFEWFRFDKNGNLVTGWFRDSDDRMYYLQTVSDGNKGRMLTGWQLIDGKWYFFNTVSDGYKGAMFRNGKTPDNYTVKEDGSWDGQPNR